MLYRLIGYRTKVVAGNLKLAFPEKTAAERKVIQDGFYHYFFDLIIETIKNFTISEAEAVLRCRVLNPEILDDFAARGRSVIGVGGHNCNWEMAALAFSSQFAPHLTMGVFSPLKDRFLNRAIRQNRMRFGTLLVDRRRVPEYYQFNRETGRMTLDFYMADQSPSTANKRRLVWAEFLTQLTGFYPGPEKFAREQDMPVVFACMVPTGERGFQTVQMTLITERPQEEEDGFIMRRYAELLEAQIRANPTHYLWTHKRWKHAVPQEIREEFYGKEAAK